MSEPDASHEQEASLGILQDPLMMLLALMLTGSLAFLLPGGHAPPDRAVDPRAVARLEREVAKLERARWDEIAASARRGARDDASSTPAGAGRDAATLQANSRRLQAAYDLASREVAELRARIPPTPPPGPTGTTPDGAIDPSQIESLLSRRDHLRHFVSVRKGLPIYSSEGSKGRYAILAEAAGTMLYVVNASTYSFETIPLQAMGVSDGVLVKAARRPDAAGDAFATIHRGDSRWRDELQRNPPSGHYIFVFVREDGFRTFLEARLVAQELGFAVGWRPISSGPIAFRSGNDTGEGPPVAEPPVPGARD